MFDLICFSHLRWGFVWQRPQHVMTRFARERRVFFVEEPVPITGEARLEARQDPRGVTVLVPRVPDVAPAEAARLQSDLLQRYVATEKIASPVLWYYTPMAQEVSRDLDAGVVVYDCMDELSGFDGAPPELRAREHELLERADVVFTGGVSLYEAKRHLHHNVHAMPSSVDAGHFARARHVTRAPSDQAPIPRPRIGFYGVIDERLDVPLLAGAAEARPDWQFVMVGPVVKIDAARLPRHPNVHYLGAKTYTELPDYVGGWDVAMLPFARNDATRFISPTKTPEYLAAGRPVVSTSIADVVRPYERLGLVRIADTPGEFAAAVEASLHEDATARLEAADRFLSRTSWDATWSAMRELVHDAMRPRVAPKRHRPTPRQTATPASGHLPLLPRWANLP